MQNILITAALLSLFMSGCAHKIEIQQGNVVTQAQLEQLRPGLERRQVRSLLGSPLLIDAFHPDRWDYYYSLSQGNEVKQRYRLSVFFSGDKVTHFDKEGEFPTEEYQSPRKDEEAPKPLQIEELL